MAAWQGDEPIITRDADMKHITIKKQVRIAVSIGDVLKQRADSVICVSNDLMNQFASCTAEIIDCSGLQSKLNHRFNMYGALPDGQVCISESGRLSDNIGSFIHGSVPEAGHF